MITKIAKKNLKSQQLIKQRPVFFVVPQILLKLLETHSFVIMLLHSNITNEHAQIVTTKITKNTKLCFCWAFLEIINCIFSEFEFEF